MGLLAVLREEKESRHKGDLHFKFEQIHPFQDGNGRVGRLIFFKECLAHNIIPFIIEDDHKFFYYRGFSEYPNKRVPY